MYTTKHGGAREAEEAFAAVCNARVVKGAEAYYRNMFFRWHSLVCCLSITGVFQKLRCIGLRHSFCRMLHKARARCFAAHMCGCHAMNHNLSPSAVHRCSDAAFVCAPVDIDIS